MVGASLGGGEEGAEAEDEGLGATSSRGGRSRRGREFGVEGRADGALLRRDKGSRHG